MIPPEVLEVMAKQWEGGQVIDSHTLMRELIKLLREVTAERRVSDVI